MSKVSSLRRKILFVFLGCITCISSSMAVPKYYPGGVDLEVKLWGDPLNIVVNDTSVGQGLFASDFSLSFCNMSSPLSRDGILDYLAFSGTVGYRNSVFNPDISIRDTVKRDSVSSKVLYARNHSFYLGAGVRLLLPLWFELQGNVGIDLDNVSFHDKADTTFTYENQWQLNPYVDCGLCITVPRRGTPTTGKFIFKKTAPFLKFKIGIRQSFSNNDYSTTYAGNKLEFYTIRNHPIFSGSIILSFRRPNGKCQDDIDAHNKISQVTDKYRNSDGLTPMSPEDASSDKEILKSTYSQISTHKRSTQRLLDRTFERIDSAVQLQSAADEQQRIEQQRKDAQNLIAVRASTHQVLTAKAGMTVPASINANKGMNRVLFMTRVLLRSQNTYGMVHAINRPRNRQSNHEPTGETGDNNIRDNPDIQACSGSEANGGTGNTEARDATRPEIDTDGS